MKGRSESGKQYESRQSGVCSADYLQSIMARRNKKKSKRRRKAARQAQNSTTAVTVRESARNGQSTNHAPKIFVPEPPQVFNPSDWAGGDGEIGRYIHTVTDQIIDSYEADPNLIERDANEERSTSRGGYSNRQLVELVQNSADALQGVYGRIEIRVTEGYLYCADEGLPISTDGVRALMYSHLSPKADLNLIGQFGLGFKSVLAVTDAPQFFSRNGSFVFDRNRAERRIRSRIPGEANCPVLRLPEAVDAISYSDSDSVLRELMLWANNVVRLPLKPDAYSVLKLQFDEFREECLFFTPGVTRLTLIDDIDRRTADFSVTARSDELLLHSKRFDDVARNSRWKLFSKKIRLSDEARENYTLELDPNDEISVSWAVPIDRMNEPGDFWAYFPSTESCLVAGILNSRWKTNNDRQNLVDGAYNDELILAFAELIADNLYQLSSKDDPARHLDALPRRREAGDDKYADMLRNRLGELLIERNIIPDLEGTLRATSVIRYPPSIGNNERMREVYSSWVSANRRDKHWLHPNALRSRERIATIGRLRESDSVETTTVAQWLETLVDGTSNEEAVEASKAAIRIAAELPAPNGTPVHQNYGKIILTSRGDFAPVAGWLYLPTEDDVEWDGHVAVHPELADDQSTSAALKKIGVKEASDKARFDSSLNDDSWGEKQWRLSRQLEPDVAASKIKQKRDWQSKLCLKTISGDWRPCHSVLLPGVVVPDDRCDDAHVAVDLVFHADDETLLRRLGVSDRPHNGWDLVTETSYKSHLNSQRPKFIDWACSEGKSKPQRDRIKFKTSLGIGPVDVLSCLSPLGQAAYTRSVLNENALANKWRIGHESPNRSSYYGTLEVDQPIIPALKEHGRIRTSVGIVPFADALGELPESREAQGILLNQTYADKIKEVFDLHEAPQRQLIYAINATPAIRITEAWPGLSQHLESEHRGCNIIHCDAIHDEYGEDLGQRHVKSDDDIIVVHMDREDELDAITDELDVLLDEGERFGILNQPTPEEIQAAREAVREQPDVESKLLQAVGEEELLDGLPDALTAYYSRNGRQFEGREVARAAISTYHTNALKQYQHALAHLDPPKQWAGSRPAIQFVTSLGFSPEWAGERGVRRDPFLEVPGPIELPPLHSYQRIVVEKLRQTLRSSDGIFGERRAMISLPTGSGKTRVAVEGIVNAITEDGFSGGVLWVADRDELCEQAVQAWQEVWRAMGSRDQILRISRMWQGQPPPMASADRHVVVASVQTLSSKFSRGNPDYDFLRDFRLIVFDEAHRSIAPTFTSVMEELGFRVRSGEKEPLLLGLTATPYRGYSETETRWLANRYGQNRLDRGAFLSDDADKVMRELQEMQILARATHMEIEGSEFELSEQERMQAQQTPWLSTNTEIRIARDAERTERIIEAYKEHIGTQAETWPTLIFATSVEHAQTLAAILNADGISARAVSGGTDRYTRRQVVEQFRAGDLKVLVNYGVFREGFDAPKTRAIIVARPVYSPNLYFQMIGRGLRGIKNGGNDRCLILDVKDNILNFDRDLAFTELDWLWD